VTPTYWFVAVDLPPEEADVASERLFALGAEGIEERDEATLARGAAGLTTLVASFPTETAARKAKSRLGSKARLEKIVGDAWRDAWKEHFRPFRLCQGLWVRPPWEEHVAKRGERVLVLEPGRAFGTGLHETTRLVAEAIRMYERSLPRMNVLDVGTGSGILVLVALAFGAREATGVDTDPDAIEVAKENAERNGMSKRAAFSMTPLARVRGQFQLVVSNIEADVLIELEKPLRQHLAHGGRMILSGILETREADVRQKLGKPIERAQLGEWVALTYTGTAPARSQ
jgi:ribosomal protein L11 methyltransferase